MTSLAGWVAHEQPQTTGQGECDRLPVRPLAYPGSWYAVAVQDEVGLVDLFPQPLGFGGSRRGGRGEPLTTVPGRTGDCHGVDCKRKTRFGLLLNRVVTLRSSSVQVTHYEHPLVDPQLPQT